MQTQILGLITPLMALLFATIFAMFWRAGRMRRHVLGFGLSYALFSVGFFVTHLLPPDVFYVFHTTQFFYTLGCVTMLGSVCERAGQRLHLGSMAFVYLASAGALVLTIIYSNDAAWRLVTVNTGYGVMFAMGATTLLMAQRRSVIDNLIIAVLALQALDFLVRPTISLLFERTIPVEAYRESLYYSIIGLALTVKGAVTAMVLFAATISEWTTDLRESSERDGLTGLRNRGSFESAMDDMLARAHLDNRALSLVVADIDHFKRVNDIWGHQAGDSVITSFGELIGKMVRGCDLAARIGGEEFCIAVWDCENDPAHRLAERIRLAFAGLDHPDLEDEIRLTASFGVATVRAGEGYQEVFARADEALYLAKSKNRNRVENAEALKQPGAAARDRLSQIGMKRTAAR